jgi:hypothetical protein
MAISFSLVTKKMAYTPLCIRYKRPSLQKSRNGQMRDKHCESENTDWSSLQIYKGVLARSMLLIIAAALLSLPHVDNNCIGSRSIRELEIDLQAVGARHILVCSSRLSCLAAVVFRAVHFQKKDYHVYLVFLIIEHKSPPLHLQEDVHNSSLQAKEYLDSQLQQELNNATMDTTLNEMKTKLQFYSKTSIQFFSWPAYPSMPSSSSWVHWRSKCPATSTRSRSPRATTPSFSGWKCGLWEPPAILAAVDHQWIY